MTRRAIVMYWATALMAALAVPSVTGAQNAEYVLVQKAMDDNAIVVRGNGSTYLIEKGVGCLSLWRYEGKRVLINSPGVFLGVGSTLVLPDANQQCRIWNAQLIASPSVPQLSPAPHPAPETSSSFSVKSLMSSAEFQAAGLSKLSTEELAALDRWLAGLVSAAATLAQGTPPTTPRGATTYEVQASVNDSRFVINGNLFEAQTYCFGVEKGDRVIFVSGSPYGACASGEFVNLRTSRSCKVWCK